MGCPRANSKHVTCARAANPVVRDVCGESAIRHVAECVGVGVQGEGWIDGWCKLAGAPWDTGVGEWGEGGGGKCFTSSAFMRHCCPALPKEKNNRALLLGGSHLVGSKPGFPLMSLQTGVRVETGGAGNVVKLAECAWPVRIPLASQRTAAAAHHQPCRGVCVFPTAPTMPLGRSPPSNYPHSRGRCIGEGVLGGCDHVHVSLSLSVGLVLCHALATLLLMTFEVVVCRSAGV